MTERELSQKLDELATTLDNISDSDSADWFREVRSVAKELRTLSGLKYTVGAVSWDDVKMQAKPTKSKFPF